MLRSAGGPVTAARHCVSAWYERPHVPTRPLEPGNPSRPLDRVVPVLELVDTRVEVAVGGVPTADVLHHHEIAGSGQPYAGRHRPD